MSASELIPEHPSGSIHTASIAEEVARGQVELHVVIVSPDRQLFEGDAHWVTLTGTDGQFGIWPNHVNLVAALGSGPLRIGRPRHDVLRYAASGGFLSVAANNVTILVDHVMTKDEIDEAAAQRDLEKAIEALAHPRSDREFVRLLDRRAWAQERIKLATS